MAQPPRPIHYRIKLQGRLDKRWAIWMPNITLRHDRWGNTILIAPVADQAALRGLLCKVWDLNLTVLAIAQTGR